jgi:hypothetical protein
MSKWGIFLAASNTLVEETLGTYLQNFLKYFPKKVLKNIRY